MPLAVDVADGAVRKTGCGRAGSRGRAGGGSGVAGLALGGGKAQKGDDGNEGVHVGCVVCVVRKRVWLIIQL